MTTHVRTVLILALTMFVASAYSPAALADKKDRSNSNSDDKKKDKDDNQNDQRNNRDRHRDDNPKTDVQQLQKVFQGNNDKQNKSDKSDNLQQSRFRGPSNDQLQKFQQPQNFQQQNGPQLNVQQQNLQNQNIQKQNLQKQNGQNNWAMDKHRDHKELHNWVVQFGGPEPFSSKWYKDHPHAWHHSHHDHDDTWKIATAAGVIGWLGWEAYHPRGPVVIYEPVPYDTFFVQRPGIVIDPANGDWMPLGVFSLMVGPGDASSRMLDLATDRFGHIRGTYYDMISGATYNVAGIIDQRTQYAQWSLESNRQLAFYTPIGELMQPQGLVTVKLPSGQRQQWQVVRMESMDN